MKPSPQKLPTVLPGNQLGPLVCALFAAIIPAALAVVIALRWPLSLIIFVSVVVPGMFISALCVGVSMGWIFMLVGRTNRRPRHMPLTVAALLLAMLQLLALAMILLRAKALPS